MGEGTQEMSLDKLQEQMGELTKSLSTLAQNQQQLQQGIGSITSSLSEGLLQGKPAPEKTSFEKKDLDDLSRGELAQMITQNVLDAIEGNYFKPMKEEIEGVRQETRKTAVDKALESARAKYDDFGAWEEEMIAIAKSTPGVSVERAYALARFENPDKAAEVDKKFGPTEKESPAPMKKFFALSPSDGSSAGSTSEDDKDDGKSDIYRAAEKNLESVLESLPE